MHGLQLCRHVSVDSARRESCRPQANPQTECEPGRDQRRMPDALVWQLERQLGNDKHVRHGWVGCTRRMARAETSIGEEPTRPRSFRKERWRAQRSSVKFIRNRRARANPATLKIHSQIERRPQHSGSARRAHTKCNSIITLEGGGKNKLHGLSIPSFK